MSAYIAKDPLALIELCLTDPDPANKCQGRLLSTDFCKQFERFAIAELKRGTNPGHILKALENTLLGMVASVVSETVPARDHAEIGQELGKSFAENLVPALAAIHAARTNRQQS